MSKEQNKQKTKKDREHLSESLDPSVLLHNQSKPTNQSDDSDQDQSADKTKTEKQDK